MTVLMILILLLTMFYISDGADDGAGLITPAGAATITLWHPVLRLTGDKASHNIIICITVSQRQSTHASVISSTHPAHPDTPTQQQPNIFQTNIVK